MSVELPKIWREFFELKEQIKKLSLPKNELTEIIKNIITEEDINNLSKSFKDDFKNINSNDALKLEILHFLSELGIYIYINNDEYKENENFKLPNCYDNINVEEVEIL
jgi:hypothetical protein